MTAVVPTGAGVRSGLALLQRCPSCGARELVDETGADDDSGWWAVLRCTACDHGWVVRS